MKNQIPQSKKISVSIGGATYHLVSHENEAYMKAIASQANDIISSIASGNPSLSNMQTYILAIINLLDALNRKSEEYDRFKAEFDVLSARETESSKELFVNRDLNFELKKEIVRVSELNRQLMLEISSLRSMPADDAEKSVSDELTSGEVTQTGDELPAEDGLTVEEAMQPGDDILSEEELTAREGMQPVDELPAEEELTARDEYFKEDDEVENAEFARIDNRIEAEDIPEPKGQEEKDYTSKQKDLETDYSGNVTPKEYEYFSDLMTAFPSDEDAPPLSSEQIESKEDPARYGEFTQPSLDEYFPSSR